MPVENSSRKSTGVVDHEHLAHLHAAAEAAREVHHLARRFLAQAELLDHLVDPGGQLGAAQAVEAAVAGQAVAHREEELGRLFLDHHRDAAADLERLLHDVEAFDGGASRGRSHQRREHAQRGGLAGPVGAEQAEDRPATHAEAEVVDRADLGAAAAAEGLGQALDDDRRISHLRTPSMFELDRPGPKRSAPSAGRAAASLVRVAEYGCTASLNRSRG